MKLGLSVKVLGRPGMKSHDTRRWQNDPHLSVSLVYLRDIMHHLRHAGIRMYRMASELAPYVAHPDMPGFHAQIEECAAELAAVGAMAREDGLRLSFHPGSFVVLNSPDSNLVARSGTTLHALTKIFEAMGLGPEAVIVIHIGGEYECHAASLIRFVDAILQLPDSVRSRLALEHDHARFSVSDCYNVHLRTGLPIVFDHQHQLLHNPEQLSVQEGLQLALSTWPQGIQPKIHFSSPRTELRTVSRHDHSGRKRELLQPPLWTQHADYVNPFEFIALLRAAEGLPAFDVLLECKAKDLALLRLRADLARFAPDLAANIDGLDASMLTDTKELYEGEIESLDGVDPSTVRVLVAVMNNPRDLQLARDQGWYRIPLKRAPRQVAADVLAFYQTAAFDEPERWTITHYAPIRRYHIVRRTDLLPDEGDHPRAADDYYKVEIGRLQQLAKPIPSRNLRRVTFIPTTMDRLLKAGEINGLWMGGGLQERLWAEQERLWEEVEDLQTSDIDTVRDTSAMHGEHSLA